jgi:uncharacterized membrane protein
MGAMGMPAGFEWFIVALLVALMILAVPIAAVAVIIRSRRPPSPPAPQLALPAQLQQIDHLLATGQIDQPEYAAMRNRILGITD